MDENKEMSFWDHLEDLRWTLVRSIVALLVFTIIGFAFMPYLYDNVIMAPSNSNFFLYKYLCKITQYTSQYTSLAPDFCNDHFDVKIISITLASQFFRHMSTSFWVALVAAFPYLIFEVWKFISPALYEFEKKNIRWVFLFGTVMFFLGCAVGYFLVFPMTFRFLATYQLSPNIVNEITIDSYMDNFLMLVLIMGIVFELPLISWLLSKLGLLDRSFFKKYRKHAIVALLLAAALITPSSDPFTLSVVFFPLYLLFELSCLFVKPASKAAIEDELETEEIAVRNE